MKIIFPVILLFLFTSCSRGGNVPSDVLPPEEFKSVLWDLMKAEDLVQFQMLKDTTLQAYHTYTGQFSQVLRQQGITKEKLERSVAFYQTRPDLLRPIFESLHTLSEKKAQELQGQP